MSVVVPVHNAGPFLAECLDSLTEQSLRALEIVVVDDASTDGTADSLRAFAASDPRVRVITLPDNRGVSAARNVGLASAEGEFVAFVDADDYLDAGMYEELVSAARDLGCEVVSCGIHVVDSKGHGLDVTPFPLPPGVRHSRPVVREALHRAWAARMLWYPVRSLYRRELLASRGVRFDESVRKGEDSLFNLQVLLYADGVACVASAPYHYRKHAASATARPLADESSNLEQLASATLGFYAAWGFDQRAPNDFYTHLLRSDLPTALVRLRAHPEARQQIQALINSAPVRAAFQHCPLISLRVPVRVLALLLLARARATVPLTCVLTAAAPWTILARPGSRSSSRAVA